MNATNRDNATDKVTFSAVSYYSGCESYPMTDISSGHPAWLRYFDNLDDVVAQFPQVDYTSCGKECETWL